MDMTDHSPETLVEQYLAGELDADTAARVRAFLDADPRRQAFVAGLRAAARGEDIAHPPHSPDEAARRALAQLEGVPRHTDGNRGRVLNHGHRGLPMARSQIWAWGVGGAAATLAAVVLVRSAMHAPNDMEQAAVHTYVTHSGQRAELTLPEDIHVVLAPNSTLEMRGNVGILRGQAFFTVPHRTNQPLTIKTGNVTTRVLGTAFDVRRYLTERATRVLVVSGRVSTGGARTVTLDARMMALATDSTTTTATVSDIGRATGWVNGTLAFRDARVADVLAAVEQWYDVRFRLTDTGLGDRLLTATLDARRSRSETLAALESVLQVRMTFVGDTIVLSNPDATVRPAPAPRKTQEAFTPAREVGR